MAVSFTGFQRIRRIVEVIDYSFQIIVPCFEEERESGRARKHATIYLFVFSAKYFFIRNDRFERIAPLRNARVKNAKTLTCFENRYVIFPNAIRSSSTPFFVTYTNTQRACKLASFFFLQVIERKQ